MNLVLYGQASVTDPSDGSEHLALSDFFCVDHKVHITRERRWKKIEGSWISDPWDVEVQWSRPKPCDGRCEVWRAKALDMPTDIREACERLLTE